MHVYGRGSEGIAVNRTSVWPITIEVIEAPLVLVLNLTCMASIKYSGNA